jgi:type III secretion protein J
MRFILIFSLFLLLLTGCEKAQTIVTGIDEREANTIIVFLDSKGIKASKMQQVVSAIGAAGSGSPKYNIVVESNQAIDAMAILNQNGLPRKQGTTLLELFAKSGFMTTDKEETIRYQAGLEQQLQNMILMIDGVIDASIQLSFPTDTNAAPGTVKEKMTAAVYVKHQGVIDDPNTHLETKIKRLISGSVVGLDINDVTVVSDRSRFTDVIEPNMTASSHPKEYVKIWSIIMSRDSATKFRVIFFLILILSTLFTALLGWMVWKIYPMIKKPGGIKELFELKPFMHEKTSKDHLKENEPPAQE